MVYWSSSPQFNLNILLLLVFTWHYFISLLLSPLSLLYSCQLYILSFFLPLQITSFYCIESKKNKNFVYYQWFQKLNQKEILLLRLLVSLSSFVAQELQCSWALFVFKNSKDDVIFIQLEK